MPPRISIVVPFYNVERYIARCIEGLLAQTYPRDRYDVTMVDNNSTDRSADMVRKYPEVRLLSQPQQGSYAARNHGIENTTGEIVAFTDADCVVEPDWLARIERAMVSTGIQLVQGHGRFASESAFLSLVADYEVERASLIFAASSPEAYYGYCGSMAVRRKALNRVGGFETVKRGGDTIFVHRILHEYSSDAIAFDPQIRLRHLEIGGIRDWLSKMYVYGKSSRGYSRRVLVRALTHGERLRVFGSTVTRNRYSVRASVALFGLLCAGLIAYSFGQRIRLGTA